MNTTMPIKPVRIQRSRARGSKLPPNTVCVTRPGRWSNPFRTKLSPQVAEWKQVIFTVKASLSHFRRYVAERLKHDPQWLEPLRGKNLACWCPPGSPCHADILLELANREPSPC